MKKHVYVKNKPANFAKITMELLLVSVIKHPANQASILTKLYVTMKASFRYLKNRQIQISK